MIGRSKAMGEIFNLAERIAPRDVTVLITGASGTGKELLARAIHNLSPRRKGAFIAVNCGAIPEGLIDAELFGFEKGAFTGAVGKREGLIRSASGGTLFLDEVGDLPLQTQLRLLRFLQEMEVRPVGSDETHQVDVRVIAATNREITLMVSEGKFRDDLYYRLSVVPVRIPDLSERPEDIPLLVMHFLEKSAKKHQMPVPKIEQRTMDSLENYKWNGNVREMENTIERLVLLSDGGTIRPEDLPPHIEKREKTYCDLIPGEPTLKELEHWYIDKILKKSGGNKTITAKILGVSRRTLQRLDQLPDGL